MDLQPLKVYVLAKAEIRGLEVAYLVKIPLAIVSVISHLFQGEKNGI